MCTATGDDYADAWLQVTQTLGPAADDYDVDAIVSHLLLGGQSEFYVADTHTEWFWGLAEMHRVRPHLFPGHE